ncbi:hypothetical protein [Cerasicoccus frondis]|uniref:hypothetical protein n=1 Tax=Cerasicoccus frondis TaxID=490090 RepID=UPI00285276A0|nr:hypothetical protein [Cerasicoccus frondis]
MPVYCYRDPDGIIHERVYHMGEAPQVIDTDAGPAKRDFGAEGVGVPPTKGWPLECVASGVNSEQAGELRSELARKGVPTEVTGDGNPIYRDANHRKKALKVRGLHDRSSFS